MQYAVAENAHAFLHHWEPDRLSRATNWGKEVVQAGTRAPREARQCRHSLKYLKVLSIIDRTSLHSAYVVERVEMKK